MKQKTLLQPLAHSALVLLVTACAYTRQITYDPNLMGGSGACSGQTLFRNAPLEKQDVTALLAGGASTSLDPDAFQLDEARIARVFGDAAPQTFSFVLLSDFQVEDRSLRFNHCLTRFLDKGPMPIETTVRGFYQDHADVFYLGFLLRAIREGLQKNTNLDLVVHLGDAVQLGDTWELAAFNELIGKFLLAGEASRWEESWTGTWLQTPINLKGHRQVPFLNVVGNHDVLTAGNFDEKMPVSLPGRITSLGVLKNMLCLVPPFLAAWDGNESSVLGSATAAQGYYQVERALPDGRMVAFIVLNTNERNLLDSVPRFQRGAFYPSISGDQFDWLENSLSAAQQNPAVALVVVMGHNQLGEITINRTGKRNTRDASFGSVKAALSRYPKVKAYFGGHLHSGAPPIVHHFAQHTLTEFVCPSAQEYPKSFGLASLRQDPLGEFTVSVKYYNLEDLLNPAVPESVQVSEERGPHDQQTRFTDWLAALQQLNLSNNQRMQLLAKHSYLSAIYDLQHDLRRDVALCFHPKFCQKLLTAYQGAQDLWSRFKVHPDWDAYRSTLETNRTLL